MIANTNVEIPKALPGIPALFPGQRVVAFIGVPGSGKSTEARRYRPQDGWVHLTLDDFRQAIWPPHRRVYWEVREGYLDHAAQSLLHAVQQEALRTALVEGFNVVLPDTHLRLSAFEKELRIIADFGIEIEWKLFDIPWPVLFERNKTRPEEHRLPATVLLDSFKAMWAPDAWWRALPSHQIQIIKQELAA